LKEHSSQSKKFKDAKLQTLLIGLEELAEVLNVGKSFLIVYTQWEKLKKRQMDSI